MSSKTLLNKQVDIVPQLNATVPGLVDTELAQVPQSLSVYLPASLFRPIPAGAGTPKVEQPTVGAYFISPPANGDAWIMKAVLPVGTLRVIWQFRRSPNHGTGTLYINNQAVGGFVDSNFPNEYAILDNGSFTNTSTAPLTIEVRVSTFLGGTFNFYWQSLTFVLQ